MKIVIDYCEWSGCFKHHGGDPPIKENQEFCNKVLVLDNGKQAYFGDLDEGFRKYDEIIMKKVDS